MEFLSQADGCRLVTGWASVSIDRAGTSAVGLPLSLIRIERSDLLDSRASRLRVVLEVLRIY